MPLNLFDWIHLAALAAMLVAAMWLDTGTRRIPNTLVLAGSLTAIGLSLSPHGIGLGPAIAGGMVGFLGFLVLYLLRALGAGDVKLAAATGLFVGYPDMLWVNVLILLAGGLLSVTWAVVSGHMIQTVHNLSEGLMHIWRRYRYGLSAQRTIFPLSATRMPYALAIGAGTAVHVLKLSPFS